MRGGLDDALDKLARRDELRRRAEGGGIGTPPAVQDLVEAIAAVVSRNPALAVTVGVEGAGDPVLLHFAVQDGIVQVSADNTVASRVAEAAPTSPRHADFDIDVDDSVPDPYSHPSAPAAEPGQATRRISYDDVHPFGSYGEGPLAGHRRAEAADAGRNGAGPSEATHPFAGAPPYQFGRPPSTFASQATRPIHTQDRRAGDGAPATQRTSGHRVADQRAMPTPLPEPIPLKVDTAETELAAKRLAALLRDNPTLLRRATPE